MKIPDLSLIVLLLVIAGTACQSDSKNSHTKKEDAGVISTPPHTPDTTPPEVTEATPPEQSTEKAIPLNPEPEHTPPEPLDATSPPPSPERTKVPPAKEVAQTNTKVPPVESPTTSASLSGTESTEATEPRPIVKKEVPGKDSVTVKPQHSRPPSHDGWDQLLRQFVSGSGKVNYPGFKMNLFKLNSYLNGLSENPPQPDWSREEKMAYWINAYNAFTIKLIAKNYPVSSITNLEDGKPWDEKWIRIGDNTYSLDQIENDILRPEFNDPRIHFAVNCAAKSCPPLLNKAWTAKNLEPFFEQQTRSFINNPSFNDISKNKVEISKIFEWYASDFGNLIDFLNQYTDTQISANAKVNYKEYDWSLNE